MGTTVWHSSLQLVVASKTHQAHGTLLPLAHSHIVLEMVPELTSFSGNQLLVLCVQWQQFPEILQQPAMDL